jgi:hypothetical protein
MLRGSFMRFSNGGVAIIIAPLIACQGAQLCWIRVRLSSLTPKHLAWSFVRPDFHYSTERRAINGLSARPCRRSSRSQRSCRDRPGFAAPASALAFRTGPVDRQTASSNDVPLRGYDFGARTRTGHSLSTAGRYTSSNRSQMTGMLRLGVRPMRLHSRPK